MAGPRSANPETTPSADDRHDNLRGDLVAGLTVGVMLVPQAMAYAMLAGLPPVAGLYASTLPLLAFAVFGSSRQLAVGPVAMISLMVYSACAPLAQPGGAEFVRLAALLALLVGITQVALGVFRMGFLVNFVSHSVLSGFTSAAAIIIALSQFTHLLGLRLNTGHSTFSTLFELVTRVGETNLYTLGLGTCTIAILVVFKRKWPHFPVSLLVVALSTLLVYWFELTGYGVQTVGLVPRGLPGLALPSLDIHHWLRLWPAALPIVFVGYMESIAVAKWIAAREGYEIKPNREFVGLGAANLAAGLLAGYPVTGGFSRTAVNYQAGAKTRLASIVTAVCVIITLLMLTPLFYHLPIAVLSAIIIVAVAGLVDISEARRLFRVKPADGIVLVATFFATLGGHLHIGILVGVILSLGLFIWRSAHPHIAELGYCKDIDAFRNIDRFPAATHFPGVLMFRVDASLYFANMGFVEHWLRERLATHQSIRCILVDLSAVNDIDAVAIAALERLIDDYADSGVRFAFAAMKGPVRDCVVRAGWDEKQTEQRFYPSLMQALHALGFARGHIPNT